MDMVLPGKLFIVSAPSGAGKTTVVQAVLAQAGRTYAIKRLITYTTKAMQPGERDGHDYHFIREAEFLYKIQQGFFIEWSTAYGHYYGSPRSIIADLFRGMSYIAILDRAGAEAVNQQLTDVVLIWLYPNSVEVLKDRLALRARDEAVDIERRLVLAQKELAEEKERPFFRWHVLNDDFNEAVFLILSIVRNTLEKSAQNIDQIDPSATLPA